MNIAGAFSLRARRSARLTLQREQIWSPALQSLPRRVAHPLTFKGAFSHLNRFPRLMAGRPIGAARTDASGHQHRISSGLQVADAPKPAPWRRSVEPAPDSAFSVTGPNPKKP